MVGGKLAGRYVRMIELRADMMLAWIVAGFEVSTGPAPKWCDVSEIGPSLVGDSVLVIETLQPYLAVSVGPEPSWYTVLEFVLSESSGSCICDTAVRKVHHGLQRNLASNAVSFFGS